MGVLSTRTEKEKQVVDASDYGQVRVVGNIQKCVPVIFRLGGHALLRKTISHSCPKTVFGVWGSLFKFATHRMTLLLTAPISATNGIEDRHKEGTVLKQSCYVGLLLYLQYFGALRRCSGP